jgi:phosphoribosylformylglycinamidine synthase II
MPHRIEIGLKPHTRDSLGERLKERIREHLHLEVQAVNTISVYTVDADLSPEELEMVVRGPFSDPIIQTYSIDRPLAESFDWLIEVGFRSGVTDNVGKTAREAIELRLGIQLREEEKVYTSTQYLIKGELKGPQVENICTGLLVNPLIQRFQVISRRLWDDRKGIEPTIPKVEIDQKVHVEEIDLERHDRALLELSQNRVLALSLPELKAIQAYFRRDSFLRERRKLGLGPKITDVELEALAQTWSEHCKHKIFNALIEYTDEWGEGEIIDGLFNTYIKGATEKVRSDKGREDLCVSVFEDNAGVVKFNDSHNLVFKVETHNTPSALDPYGGALSGIVGVNRDPFGTGKGARLIFNVDTFCFAPPDFAKPLAPRLFHPRRVYEGVREGVEHGGNKSGIPTVNGCVVFDDRYAGKPLVYCGTGGIMPRTIRGEPSHIKDPKPDDLIVMTGGRIGKDGIHGATFSSEELHEESPTAAVQIGDPITQKKMTEFLLKARDLGLYRSITDNGAGGLSCSVGEMGRHIGCVLELEKAPLKYAGLNPWEILLSEAQERMTLAVPPAKIDVFLQLAEKMDVEATVLGKFAETGKFHVRYGRKTVGFLDMDFLHEGLPKMRLRAKWQPNRSEEPSLPVPRDLTEELGQMLSRFNICSKDYIIRQYDHEVQGGSVVKPLVGKENDGPSDAAVLRPLLDSYEGVVVSNGICPRYSDIDTYHMMACAIDEAIRNNVAVGGSIERMVGLDNFCWPDPVQSEKTPDGEYKLAQLVRANKALYDFTTAFGVPCISGKDSMKNDYLIGNTKISIPPTVLFSVMGKIDDVRKAVTMDAKGTGHLVYVVGRTLNELGGSEYYAMKGYIGNTVPKVDAPRAVDLYRRLNEATGKELISSCHDCSDGGLGVALAETSFSGGSGMAIDLRRAPATGVARDDFLLFSETQSRFVVTVCPEKREAFERVFTGREYGLLGKTTSSGIFKVIGLGGKEIIRADIRDLKAAWKRPLGI